MPADQGGQAAPPQGPAGILPAPGRFRRTCRGGLRNVRERPPDAPVRRPTVGSGECAAVRYEHGQTAGLRQGEWLSALPSGELRFTLRDRLGFGGGGHSLALRACGLIQRPVCPEERGCHTACGSPIARLSIETGLGVADARLSSDFAPPTPSPGAMSNNWLGLYSVKTHLMTCALDFFEACLGLRVPHLPCFRTATGFSSPIRIA